MGFMQLQKWKILRAWHVIELAHVEYGKQRMTPDLSRNAATINTLALIRSNQDSMFNKTCLQAPQIPFRIIAVKIKFSQCRRTVSRRSQRQLFTCIDT